MKPTLAFNVLGVPSLAVPMLISRNGLPVAVQLAAAAGDERLLYRIGLALARGPREMVAGA